jgi:hypothetical protein
VSYRLWHMTLLLLSRLVFLLCATAATTGGFRPRRPQHDLDHGGHAEHQELLLRGQVLVDPDRARPEPERDQPGHGRDSDTTRTQQVAGADGRRPVVRERREGYQTTAKCTIASGGKGYPTTAKCTIADVLFVAAARPGDVYRKCFRFFYLYHHTNHASNACAHIRTIRPSSSARSPAPSSSRPSRRSPAAATRGAAPRGRRAPAGPSCPGGGCPCPWRSS